MDFSRIETRNSKPGTLQTLQTFQTFQTFQIRNAERKTRNAKFLLKYDRSVFISQNFAFNVFFHGM